MQVRRNKRGTILSFIGDVSMIRMNRFGVVWQESEDGATGWTRIDHLNRDQEEQFRDLAKQAGAVRWFKGNGTGIEEWNFSGVAL